jgi:glycosyltransferase involved in cell wall biosynthesis
MFLILTDYHRGSYKIMGDYWRKSLLNFGKVVEKPTPQSNAERKYLESVFKGQIIFHNTLGESFIPFNNCYNIALPYHEWSKYPKNWLSLLDEFDEIWVTTKHVKDVLLNSGLRKIPKILMPEMYEETSSEKKHWEFGSKVSFLSIGEPHFRKGHHFLMEGYMKAFTKLHEAKLTIKTSPSCNWISPREDIYVIKESWDRLKLLNEYSKHDCLISASLGEGLGLPIIEAINALLPVCTNFWGGHKTFLQKNKFYQIKHREIIQPFTSNPAFYAEGQRCAYSSPNNIKDAFLQVVNSQSSRRQSIALGAKKHFLDICGKDVVQKKIAQSLNSIRKSIKTHEK